MFSHVTWYFLSVRHCHLAFSASGWDCWVSLPLPRILLVWSTHLYFLPGYWPINIFIKLIQLTDLYRVQEHYPTAHTHAHTISCTYTCTTNTHTHMHIHMHSQSHACTHMHCTQTHSTYVHVVLLSLCVSGKMFPETSGCWGFWPNQWVCVFMDS